VTELNTLELFKESLPSILSGLNVTLQLSIISLSIASLLGLIFGLMMITKNKFLRFVATVYVDLIRGTPLIVQAFFIYFGLPSAFHFKLSAYLAGIIALSLNSGAYMAEIFRAGILAVDKGQMEAARSLGLSYYKSMTKVILPQAIRKMIPAIINQFIIAIKDTSLLSVIGIRELTQSGEIIIASNYRAFEIWGMVAVFYLALIMLISTFSRRIERCLKL